MTKLKNQSVALPPYGQVVKLDFAIHAKADCSGHCAFHTPSDHHMKDWPTLLRMDRADMLVERVCEHGVGHPDIDSLNFIRSTDGDKVAFGAGIHGCCGCCAEPEEGVS